MEGDIPVTRYREPMAHRESRIREAIDVLCFVGLVFVVMFILSIADVR